MSKSDPGSAIFVEDTEADVNVKIKKAYCPPGVVENNPILDYLKHIIFAVDAPVFKISRSEQNGGMSSTILMKLWKRITRLDQFILVT